MTFVQVKDALELYPLFAFLAVRFAIATGVLALPARARIRGLGRDGGRAGIVLGVHLAAGFGLQTAGLQRTTVSSTGFITGLYVVLTPLLALLLFRQAIAPLAWARVVLAAIRDPLRPDRAHLRRDGNAPSSSPGFSWRNRRQQRSWDGSPGAARQGKSCYKEA